MLSTYQLAPPYITGRFYCLAGVSSVLCDRSVAPDKDDFKFLSEVYNDESEPAVNRVICSFTKGVCESR